VVAILIVLTANNALMLKSHIFLDMKTMQNIIELAGDDTPTCVAFAPAHPIFCKNVLPVYLGWDELFLLQSNDQSKVRQHYVNDWSKAFALLPETKPDIFVEKAPSSIWENMEHALGQLSVPVSDKYQAFKVILEKEYSRQEIKLERGGSIVIWLKNS
jgi:hypothetical protein